MVTGFPAGLHHGGREKLVPHLTCVKLKITELQLAALPPTSSQVYSTSPYISVIKNAHKRLLTIKVTHLR